jgi:GNAT superfamily N-acetyltransferase
VHLRRLSEADRQGMAEWLEETAAGANGGALTVILNKDDRPIGALGYRLGVPEDGLLAFDGVAVEPRLRGLGLESEAVRLVEENALERGLARRFWSGVSRDDGLGLYFWLRLGYSPARPDGGPWPGDPTRDIICMIRSP